MVVGIESYDEVFGNRYKIVKRIRLVSCYSLNIIMLLCKVDRILWKVNLILERIV